MFCYRYLIVKSILLVLYSSLKEQFGMSKEVVRITFNDPVFLLMNIIADETPTRLCRVLFYHDVNIVSVPTSEICINEVTVHTTLSTPCITV